MVRDLVNRLGYHRVGDGNVPGPKLVQLVTLPVGGRAFSQCRGESRSHHLTVDFCHLPVEVSTDDDFSLGILPDDALHEADDCLRSLHHEAFLPRFQVNVKDVDLLSA